MTTLKMRTEQEIMAELALVVVKLQADFVNDGSQYSMPNGHGQVFLYDTEYLDIRFIEDNRTDSVVKFKSTTVPQPSAFYC
ncbi:hypothetical protein [Aggregatibacter actinomycetemcomitans]|nr:hypothetical protein [Aggregatibacter actinomycetemcomitans]AMQ91569.1 hypothetical protein ACT74_02510 [Aggregatibacter actinomycetemcomitans]KND83656.1 hypothetical protein SCC1398_0205045 [Aggregatibacter actinomycetemcomitans serotype b str. SCC1398]KOE52875.1 hypothetical protein SCC4092_0208670 [Aggregatibacter actinomycetemcomitans serotype b str. SCC4092]KOE53259.1 hypothetical protein S23A_0207590 [Aggregatibacter actinomycetemcomitans serotype b str. S23A]KOE53537.1 hypothetical p